MAAKRAVNGTVANQDTAISLTIPRFSVGRPRASPTPITEPTKVWVVETGNPIFEQTRTTVAPAKVAQKPREGVISVIFFPIVSITRLPQTKSPNTINPPPKARIQVGMATFIATVPLFRIETTAARGPTAFATSLDPWAKAM